jgi:arylsulfatase A-like enzyme
VIDLTGTILSVAGCELPETVQGVSMQPLFQDPSAEIRRYAFSEHNWHDYEALGRSVRHGDYILVRNYRTQQAWQGPADSVRSPSHKSLQTLRDSGSLNAAQSDVFLAPRPEVELYNVKEDPHQMHNLAGDKGLQDTQKQLQQVLDEWREATHDSAPDIISPDTFDRETGERLPKEQWEDVPALTPGEDRQADRTNDSGPR